MKFNSFFLSVLISVSFTISGCKGLQKSIDNFNLFTIQDDVALGKEVSKQIESDPKQFPILPERGNEKVYSFVRNISKKILNTGKVEHRSEFVWQIKIIDDDKTLNAFCTPGGYIYVYTGLIKFLDSEDQLAGVMGHEMAHAALRHSTRQMTKVYGLDAVRYIITGKAEPGVLEQIALGLASLKFSRSHEEEADEYSVRYLCSTEYKADGAAGFFQKIKGKGGTPPEFLSTHPDPGNRILAIRGRAQQLNCSGNAENESEYSKIKKLLR